MADIQTKPTGVDVDAFLQTIPQPRRGQAQAVRELMTRVTGQPAVMWGPAILGFGSMRYEAKTRSGDMPRVAFSPRKEALTLYGLYEEDWNPDEPLLEELGPHTTGKWCLYLKSLDDVDQYALERLVRQGWERGEPS
ncbi:MAG: DUF1801 domain-containing protein [Rhodoglobus sp.]